MNHLATWVSESAAGIDFPLRKGGVVTGTIRDEDTGTGIPDITVTVYDQDYTAISFQRTDENGFYSIRPFLTGDYRLYANTDPGSVPSERYRKTLECFGCAFLPWLCPGMCYGAREICGEGVFKLVEDPLKESLLRVEGPVVLMDDATLREGTEKHRRGGYKA